MHFSSYQEMARAVTTHLNQIPAGSLVADVGSMDINGSYRALIEPRFKYIGLDLAAGNNVDLVMPSPFFTGLSACSIDAVISGQCLEHCENPFRLVEEIFRILKPGGIAILTAPWMFQIHRYPLDCWRILPDGMAILIDRAGGEVLKTYIIATDCWGIGKKKL